MKLVKLSILLMAFNSAIPCRGEDSNESTIDVVNDSGQLQRINSKLSGLIKTLQSLSRTNTAPGLGAQVLDSKRALDRAEASFAAKNWPVAISESVDFLTLTQKPDAATWLRAQFILARSYEENGQLLRATQAYTRYLATYTTTPSQNYAELTDVFERLVRLATKQSQANQAELSRFLSAISAMEHPSSVSEELKYLTAVAGSNAGQRDMAIAWLGVVDSKSDTGEIKARAKYFRALIAIHGKDWQTAADQLEAITQLDNIGTSARDGAYLSLARVQIKLNKNTLALSSYEQIKPESSAYRDASFEKIFLLIKLNRDREARDQAKVWLASYPDHIDAIQLRTISSWLDLRAGELDLAKTAITGTTEDLNKIQTSLKNNFQGPTLTQDDAIRLATLIKGQVQPAPEHEEILAMFRQLADMNQRLLEIDGVERSIIYAIAKGDLRQFRPNFANQLAQYDRLADDILQAGAGLVQLDSSRLGNRLTDVDRQKLKANGARRAALFGKYEQQKRSLKRWAGWAVSADQLVKLAKDWERLGSLTAQKSSMKIDKSVSADAEDLSGKIESARSEMIQTLKKIRIEQAANVANQSSLSESISVIEDFAQLLHDDHQILLGYESKTEDTLESLDDQDSRTVWNSWQNAVRLIHSNVKSLKAEANHELASTLKSLETIDARKTSLLGDIKHLTEVLETHGGESLKGILSHYDNAVSQRVGRQLKWAGDLEYLRYMESTNAQGVEQRRQALETQILNDDMRDYGQRRTK